VQRASNGLAFLLRAKTNTERKDQLHLEHLAWELKRFLFHSVLNFCRWLMGVGLFNFNRLPFVASATLPLGQSPAAVRTGWRRFRSRNRRSNRMAISMEYKMSAYYANIK